MIAENFPNLGNGLDVHIHKADGFPNKLNLKEKTLQATHYSKVSSVKDKERTLKSKGKEVYNAQQNPSKTRVGFTSRSVTSQESLGNIFKGLKL